MKGSILFVSGFDRRKNVGNLLKAYRILRERGRKERLLLKGVVEPGVGYYQDVPAMVRQHGLEGQVDVDSSYADDARLASLYRSASMLVVPSFVEGFGLPVLEAMACGCPVACSNAASLPEVGGDAAQYFDPHDPSDMATVMERILTRQGLRRSMIIKGHQNMKRFSWDNMAREILSALRETSGGG
jgi:glycosyltransferase involved in cell wall biosynthesis